MISSRVTDQGTQCVSVSLGRRRGGLHPDLSSLGLKITLLRRALPPVLLGKGSLILRCPVLTPLRGLRGWGQRPSSPPHPRPAAASPHLQGLELLAGVFPGQRVPACWPLRDEKKQRGPTAQGCAFHPARSLALPPDPSALVWARTAARASFIYIPPSPPGGFLPELGIRALSPDKGTGCSHWHPRSPFRKRCVSPSWSRDPDPVPLQQRQAAPGDQRIPNASFAVPLWAAQGMK